MYSITVYLPQLKMPDGHILPQPFFLVDRKGPRFVILLSA